MIGVGPSGRLARAFLESKLTPLLIAAALGLGALALLATPREEEPQIRVPMVDVAVAHPGAEPDDGIALRAPALRAASRWFSSISKLMLRRRS